MTQTQLTTDIRRYISIEASPKGTFEVKIAKRKFADGEWLEVQESQIKASIKGNVPDLIPVIGGERFDVTVSIKLTGEDKAEVNISEKYNNLNSSAEGNFITQGDELKIVGLKFSAPFETISEVSLTRWKNVETRFSFYRIIYTRSWFRSWFVPPSDAKANEEEYPPLNIQESATR